MKISTKELKKAIKVLKKTQAETIFFLIREKELKLFGIDEVKVIETTLNLTENENENEKEIKFFIRKDLIFSLGSKIIEESFLLKEEEEQIIIFFETSKSKFILPKSDFEDYQRDLFFEETEFITEIKKDIFSNMINKVLYCIGEQKGSIYNNILLDISPDRLKIAATDAKRMAIVERIEDQFESEEKILVTYDLIKLFLSIKTKTIIIQKYKKGFIFIFDNIIIYLLKKEMSFPDYQKVIPATFEREIGFDKKEMIQLLERISLFCNRIKQETKIKIVFNSDFSLSIFSINIDNGQGEERILFTAKEAFTYTMFIDIFFLIEALTKIEGDKVFFKFNEEESPICLIEENYLSIIMPMKKE